MACPRCEELREAAARTAACWDCLCMTEDSDAIRGASPDLALSLDELSEEVERDRDDQEAPR